MNTEPDDNKPHFGETPLGQMLGISAMFLAFLAGVALIALAAKS